MRIRRTLGRANVLCAVFLLAATLVAGGCSDRLPVAPVEGRVTYNGKPLTFGSVSFQPEIGPRATGLIQPDGTFRLTTYNELDGAVLGPHRVAIVCAEHQDPSGAKRADDGEGMYSRSLIPQKYTFPETSGFTADVAESNQPFEFHLTD